MLFVYLSADENIFFLKLFPLAISKNNICSHNLNFKLIKIIKGSF